MDPLAFYTLLQDTFQKGFGDRVGRVVLEHNLMGEAFELSVNSHHLPLPAAERDKIGFHAAYAIEKAFFLDQERFAPWFTQFIEAFPSCRNRSVRRHFGKIMATLLRNKQITPNPEQAAAIAESCVDWLSDPKERVAVKVWALEVLRLLAGHVFWVPELLPDLVETLSRAPSPAMQVRLKRIGKGF